MAIKNDSLSWGQKTIFEVPAIWSHLGLAAKSGSLRLAQNVPAHLSLPLKPQNPFTCRGIIVTHSDPALGQVSDRVFGFPQMLNKISALRISASCRLLTREGMLRCGLLCRNEGLQESHLSCFSYRHVELQLNWREPCIELGLPVSLTVVLDAQQREQASSV